MKEIEELKKELQFKEDRISDLLVERDTGVWRNKLLEQAQKQRDKDFEEIEDLIISLKVDDDKAWNLVVNQLIEEIKKIKEDLK